MWPSGCKITVLSTTTILACSTLVLIYLLQPGGVKKLDADQLETYSFQAEKLTDGKCIHVCESRNCIMQAESLLKSIDISSDPCENFQQFLCGSYEQLVGQNEMKLTQTDMADKLMLTLKNLIENIKAEPGSAGEKIKILYNSCVNLGSSELRAVKDLVNVLNSIEIFNWPYLAPDFKFSEAGLHFLLATLISYLELRFLSFHVEADRNNYDTESKEKIIRVLFYPVFMSSYAEEEKDELVDVLKYFDMELEDVQIILNDRQAFREALGYFEYEFHDPNYKNSEENSTDIYIDCSITEDENWVDVCEVVEIYLNMTSLKPYVTTNKIVVETSHLRYIKNLIPRLKSLPHRSVANFFAFNFLQRHVDELNFSFKRNMQKHMPFYKVTNNKWKQCVRWIQHRVKPVLENEFVKTYFTSTYIEELHDIYQWHTNTIIKMIDQQAWISDEAKITLKNHIQNLDCNLMKAKRMLPNDTFANEFLKLFNPTPNSFLYNALDFMKNLGTVPGRLGLSKADNDWIQQPAFRPGANYDPEDNEINFYYGSLMPPSYYAGHEKFINLILFGPTVSHEIGHGVTYLLQDVVESLNVTKDAFFEKKLCLENQFSNFKFRILDEKLNGTLYVVENLSDNIAYAVTDKMIEEVEPEQFFMLPGLPYTPKQLLYMNSRQIWCSKLSRKIEELLRKDGHAPDEYRLIGSVQNSEGFSEAFSCSEGSYMNPAVKCSYLDSV